MERLKINENGDPAVYLQYIKEIINGMSDWVRVLDKDNNVVFTNRQMAKDFNEDIMNKKCYHLFGRDKPCENCITNKAIFEGISHQKEEIINGKTYLIASSPLKNSKGIVTGVIEVFRDISDLKSLQNTISEQNRIFSQDLMAAKGLQYSLLPQKYNHLKIDFSFVYRPCEMLGGDYLSIFNIDSSHIGVLIGDVSGHGVSAAMLTVFLRYTLSRTLLSPAKALENLYYEFNQSNFDKKMYITVLYAIIDTKNKSLTFSNAGHIIPFILFGNKSFKTLRTPGIPISNWSDNPDYKDKSVKYSSKDRLFFCTDGLIESRDSKGRQFGEDRLLDVLLSDISAPKKVLKRILDNVYSFSNINSQEDMEDDISMGLIEFK